MPFYIKEMPNNNNWLVAKRWLLRRITLLVDLSRHFWPRQIPRRLAFLGCALFVLLVYTLLQWSDYKLASRQPGTPEHCVADYLIRKGISHPLSTGGDAESGEQWRDNRVAFIGNGFLGLDVASDRRLVLLANDSAHSHLHTGFQPLVDVQMPLASQQDFVVFADTDEGVARSVYCSTVGEKCVCISQTIYAHRTRPNLLVQDIHAINPSTSSFSLTFERRQSGWEENKGNPSPVFTKLFNSGKQSLAIQCSSIPSATVSIKPKVEESFRFICAVEQSDDKQGQDQRQHLVDKVSATFRRFYAMHSDQLDQEHVQAWKKLNSATFHISYSKAPNTLNQAQIDAVRHALLSSVRAPLLENNWNGNEAARKEAERSLVRDSELCYTGHSTLLTPSKLWQRWTDLRSTLRTLDIWKMTLEHRGCSRLMRSPTGAHALLQAFLLSLCAGTFTSSAVDNSHQNHADRNKGGSGGRMKLEVGLDPESELHRHIQIEGLRVGASGAELAMEFQLDLSLKPFVSLRTHGGTTPLYACTAGCLEAPHSLSQKPVSLAIKVTRPRTPIIFVSEHREQLELVKKTLHVIETIDAPAHEQHMVDLHKHGAGGSGGLPTLFWVVLGGVLVAFHLFLFKLLYNEWIAAQPGKGVPYSKYSKKVLFRRE